MQVDLQAYIASMPKAELHIHLEGAIQPRTVLELARRHNKMDTLPGDDEQALRDWFVFTDFPHFVNIYVTIQDLIRTADDFALIAYENGADMAAQNIRYRELTVTTVTHTDYQKKAISIAEILEGLDAGRRQARHEFGVEMRWVFDVPRNLSFGEDGQYNPRLASTALDHARQGMEYGVVGFGLGGYEVGAPPEPFAHAFAGAKEAGLLSVPHAGETMGAPSVWGAVRDLRADRIGHGVRAIEDPKLIELLRERQIPLEINPTSNDCLHVFPSLSAHPFRRLDELGLVVTVNSDDPPLFNTSLSSEYLLLARNFGYDQAGLARIGRNAFITAGMEPDLKSRLLDEFDSWAAAQPFNK